MGLGGHLAWTPTFEGLSKKHNMLLYVKEGGVLNKSPIFLNNPYLTIESKGNYKVLDISNSHVLYGESCDQYNIQWKGKIHMIHYIAQAHHLDISKIPLQPQLYFTTEEENYIYENFVKKLPKNYIAIEPGHKTTFTANSIYPFEKWQQVVDKMKNYTFVQISPNNIPDLKGKNVYRIKNLTYRQACLIIKHATMLASTEGGFPHGARAVNTQSAVVWSGWVPKFMFEYPDCEYVYTAGEHPPGFIREGKKVTDPGFTWHNWVGYNAPYEPFLQEVKKHNYLEVVNAICRVFERTKK